jgi:hypothetical protein
MINQEFSALMGCLGSNTDITTELPSRHDSSFDALYMTLHIRLSRHMASILTSSCWRLLAFWSSANPYAAVHGPPSEFDVSIIKHTQSLLRQLAELSTDVTALLDTHFQTVKRSSRMALWLILSYHHVSNPISASRSIPVTDVTVWCIDDNPSGNVCPTHGQRLG